MKMSPKILGNSYPHALFFHVTFKSLRKCVNVNVDVLVCFILYNF